MLTHRGRSLISTIGLFVNGISFAVAKSQRLFSVEDPSVQSDDDEDRTMTMPISAQFVQTDWFQADVVNERVNGALR